MKKVVTALVGVCVAGALTACAGADETAENAGPDLASAPQNVVWQPVAGIESPVESTDGPRESQPVLHGYAQTPQGAVVAAINGQVAMATANDELWDEVSALLLAPGQGRDQWAQGRALLSIPEGTVQQNPAMFEGFRVADYTPENAQVVLAANYPGVGLTAYPVQLTWQDDWKIVMPTQDTAPDLEPLQSLDGFTAFSATEGQ
ncbi:hypothetical protein [Corynebacterium sanguinis]|uniref:hypothetical protein n=1 Tax=Corynebacterium sanguinis TaxID=2594913 RepID=UPI0021BD7EE4|nr:hypothetical protein [Corynebacterium sanguinis]